MSIYVCEEGGFGSGFYEAGEGRLVEVVEAFECREGVDFE
jgi:hypothetical protein